MNYFGNQGGNNDRFNYGNENKIPTKIQELEDHIKNSENIKMYNKNGNLNNSSAYSQMIKSIPNNNASSYTNKMIEKNIKKSITNVSTYTNEMIKENIKKSFTNESTYTNEIIKENIKKSFTNESTYTNKIINEFYKRGNSIASNYTLGRLEKDYFNDKKESMYTNKIPESEEAYYTDELDFHESNENNRDSKPLRKLDSLYGEAKVYFDNSLYASFLRENIENDCKKSINEICSNCFSRRNHKKEENIYF